MAIYYVSSASLAGLHIYLYCGCKDIRGAENLYRHRAVAGSEDFFRKGFSFEDEPFLFRDTTTHYCANHGEVERCEPPIDVSSH